MKTLKSNPSRLADLRAKCAGKLQPAPAFKFGSKNSRSCHNLVTTWRNPVGNEIASFLPYRPAGNFGFSIDFGKPISGLTLREAYQNAQRAARLIRHDVAALLRKNAALRAHCEKQQAHNIRLFMDLDTLHLCKDLDLATARTERRRALLTARARGPKSARLPAAVTVTLPPESHWSDVHVLAYLRATWSRFSQERKEYLALRLINEIVTNQRNSAWTTIVHEYQAAKEEATAQAVQS